MKNILFSKLLRPALFALPPERAHQLSIAGLKSGIVPNCPNARFPKLKATIAGLEFPNPLGIAAGYDKNGEVPAQLLRMGFGFAEIGTITPRPQSGNPQPRVFRLPRHQALINRLGFNNEGHAAVIARLENYRSKGILGINIGANKDSADFVEDYVAGIRAFSPYASYFTINISSPNTPGLRGLQAADALQRLVDEVLRARDNAMQADENPVPVFLKIAPDLENRELDDIADVANRSALDGMIISNTTLDRKTVAGDPQSSEQGGLSGRPLFAKSTIILARMRLRLSPGLPIIGVGGVDSVETAIAKFEAGANLVQLYTGLIYQGPGLPAKILRELNGHLVKSGLNVLDDLIGTKTDQWAARTADC